MKIEVKPGVIPRQSLDVLTKGFGRREGDPWVEEIARMFLEAWPGAYQRGHYTAEGPRDSFILPLPQEARDD